LVLAYHKQIIGKKQQTCNKTIKESEVLKMAETIYKKEEKPEVDRFVELIKKMNDSEQSNMLIFMQGVQFAKNANEGAVLCNQ